ncbi:MAG TPA: hypothetical protein VMG08_13370 [Allosphingosinicella sp.]|nr:hypothetical protein [Allosphingosinicella sp.]
MRGLFRLLLTFCLFAGLATGAVSHAAELGGHGAEAAAGDWQHADGDHDEVPSDGDNNAPHHHSLCHGHEVGAPFKTCAPRLYTRAPLPRPAAEAAPPGGTPALLLRPPIA